MGEFDDVLAMEPGDEWDDYDAVAVASGVLDLAPLVAELRLPNALVHLRGELDASWLEPLVDLSDPRLELWDDAPVVTLTIDRSDGAPVIVDLERGVVGGGADDDELLDSLVAVLGQLAVQTDPLRLHLDAACVEIDLDDETFGVVLVHRDCATRHRLVAELLRSGARHLGTDHTVLLPGSRTTFAAPGPLSRAGSDGSRWIAPSALSEVRPFTSTRAVVFVELDAGATGTLGELDTAEGCARLLRDGLGVERFGVAATDVVATLAGDARFWQLSITDPAEIAAPLTQLRPREQRELTTLMRLDRRATARTAGRSRDADPDRSARAPESIRVARFDSGGVLCDGETGKVIVISDDEADELERIVVHGAATTSAVGLTRVRAAGIDLDQLEHRAVREARSIGPEAFGLPNCPRRAVAAELWRGRRLGTSLDAVGALAQAVQVGALELTDDERVLVLERHRQVRGEVERIEAVLVRAVEIVEAAGVVPVVLGAPVSAHEGVLPPAVVDAERIDLLIAKDAVEQLVGRLCEHGFELAPQRLGVDSPGPAAELLEQATGVPLRLHSQLAVGPFGELVDHDELHGRTVPLSLDGLWCRALHPDDRFVLACVQIDPEDARDVLAERDVVLSAPRAEALMAEALEASERWGATRGVLAAVRSVDDRLPGLSPWLVERARREVAPTRPRRRGVLRRRRRS